MKAEQGEPNPGELRLDCTAEIVSPDMSGGVQFKIFCRDSAYCLAALYNQRKTDLLQQLADSARKTLNIHPNMSGRVFAPNASVTITALLDGNVCDEYCPNTPPSDKQTTMHFPLKADPGTDGNE